MMNLARKQVERLGRDTFSYTLLRTRASHTTL